AVDVIFPGGAAANPAARQYRWDRFWHPTDRTSPGIGQPSSDAPETTPSADIWLVGKLSIRTTVPDTRHTSGRRRAGVSPSPKHLRPPECCPFPPVFAGQNRARPISRNASGRPSRWPPTRPIPAPGIAPSSNLPSPPFLGRRAWFPRKAYSGVWGPDDI